MGIRNIDDLKGNPSVHPEQPTEAPNESNTQAGKPSTPIDNVAEQQAATESATGDDPETGDQHG